MKKILLAASILLMNANCLLAQQDTIDYYSLSLEELMNIKIVSASKKAESLFDAALSASVITSDEIRNAGATSIPEALRLIPGVIVREQTNGNYDIHVRGLDNVPPNSLILSATNTTTLVMINNRPVYNYMQGGTFWESLPIDLNDVDKIEVIRGPSSTLYGPNAVSGVINILTRKVQKDGWSVNGNGQLGTQQTAIANTSLAYKFNEKLNITLSGNMQSRGRDTRFLDLATDQWVNSASELSVPDPEKYFPYPNKSMKKYGVNSFIHYDANEKVQLHLATGFQDSRVQTGSFDHPVANIGTATTQSNYADFHASTYGFTSQISYTTAKQDPILGMTGSTYDYNVTDASLEYELNVKGVSIKPGVTYRSATYDDGSYWDATKGEGSLHGARTMETLGGGLRFDTRVLQEKLRLTGGVRMDRFSHPDKWFTSFQAAASYKFNERNLIRLVYSKAFRSPFIFDTYINYEILRPIGAGMSARLDVKGNKNLDLLSSKLLELGYRTMPANNISIDVEGYYTQTQNYNAVILGATVPTPQYYPVVAVGSLNVENIPLKVAQMGATLSLTAVAGKFQVKPFITVQKTTLSDYSYYFSTADAAPSPGNGFNPAANNVNSGIGKEQDHKFTPKAYGGAYVNYTISSKFNFNISTYWFSKQTFYQQKNIEVNDGVHGVGNISGKAIVNAKFSYTPIGGLSIFVTGKNLLNQRSQEYYRSDATPMNVLGGVSFNF